MTFSQVDLTNLRDRLHAHIDRLFDEMTADHKAPAVPTEPFKMPTIADGHDPRNKNGLNLTPRGVEIIFRVFDDGGGYNRAAKMLMISQGAAKNRKGDWERAGGINRIKVRLDID